MIKECIKTGSTIDEAKAAALLELGLSEYDDYHVEVIKTPVKKTFGLFGGSPAEVKVSVEVPDVIEAKPEKKVEQKPKTEPVQKADKKSFNDKKQTERKDVSEKPVQQSSEKKDTLKATDSYKKTEDYIKEIILGLGMAECKVSTFADEEEIVFELDCGDDYGIVIGRRGETLDAVQYLARMVANKGNTGYKRVSINVGNYREKRAAVLVSLANKTANRAIKSGRNISLEPMNPYERRIIHTAVQDIKGVTSFSTGVDLNRRVIIAPENASKSNNNNYGFKPRDNKGNDRRPQKREPYVPQVSETRERKSDAQGVSVYGKVELNKD